jgi:hypothetical protein
VSTRLARVGYWYDGIFSPLPHPQDFVDVSWDPAERTLVVAYLRAGRVRDKYFGYAHCRFACGRPDRDMGYCDLTDDTYVWPEGYAHYVEDHLVRPPIEFVEHVKRQAAR